MKILYDHQMFSYQKYGGITKYFVELIKNISADHECHLSILFSENQYLKENRDLFNTVDLLPDINFKGKATLHKWICRVNQAYSSRRIASNNFDLLHPTFYHDYFHPKLKRPYIITVHDLIEFKFKHLFTGNNSNRDHIEKAVMNANRLIAISNNTKQDLLEIFDLDPDKIDVIHHGYNNSPSPVSENKFGDYLLFVGDRRGYKNFTLFIKAIAPLLKREGDLKVVCVGAPFSREEQSLFHQLKISKQLLAKRVDENTLNNLYAHAKAFVYPSLYEGFGLPVLEAFSNGCPACLSDSSCFPEIAADAAQYFDPTERNSILDSVEKVVYDVEWAAQLKIAGKKQLTHYSWEKTAEETLAAYQKTV